MHSTASAHGAASAPPPTKPCQPDTGCPATAIILPARQVSDPDNLERQRQSRDLGLGVRE